MAKLSGHQFLVLTRMARGDEIYSTMGHAPLCFWIGAVGDRSPGWPTVFSLNEKGFIEEYAGSPFWRYRITTAGRAALQSEPGK